jgi:hypothetical protein
MILDQLSTNILSDGLLDTGRTHIAFAVNTEMATGGGLAGQVRRRFWHDLEDIDQQPLGTILSHSADDDSRRIFHALVCHTNLVGGWWDSPRWLAECLDKLYAPPDSVIHIAKIGDGLVGREQGADVPALMDVLRKHRRKFIVYSL